MSFISVSANFKDGRLLEKPGLPSFQPCPDIKNSEHPSSADLLHNSPFPITPAFTPDVAAIDQHPPKGQAPRYDLITAHVKTLPVIPRGTCVDEVKAYLKPPYLWPKIEVLSLRACMGVRLKGDLKAGEFSSLILKITVNCWGKMMENA